MDNLTKQTVIEILESLIAENSRLLFLDIMDICQQNNIDVADLKRLTKEQVSDLTKDVVYDILMKKINMYSDFVFEEELRKHDEIKLKLH